MSAVLLQNQGGTGNFVLRIFSKGFCFLKEAGCNDELNLPDKSVLEVRKNNNPGNAKDIFKLI